MITEDAVFSIKTGRIISVQLRIGNKLPDFFIVVRKSKGSIIIKKKS